VVEIVNQNSAEAEDDVAVLDAAARGGRAGVHLPDEGAVRTIKPEPVTEVVAEPEIVAVAEPPAEDEPLTRDEPQTEVEPEPEPERKPAAKKRQARSR